MTNGIVSQKEGFAVKNFETGEIAFEIGNQKYASYEEACKKCVGKFYPQSYFPYLMGAGNLKISLDTDTWENMVYAGDPRGVWDNEKKEYRNVSAMDRGAATEDEIAYIDALDATHKSLMAMAE